MLLGVDIGGSRLKAAVYGDEGKMLAFASQGYSPTYPQPGWVEIAPTTWWQAFCDAIKEIAQCVDLGQIKALGVSSTNATLGIDRAGQIVMPGILFSDQRSIEECEYIQEALGEERILSITGNRVMPGTCSAPTILWLKNKHSEEYQKTYKFMQPSTYFVYKLTGQVVIDRSRAIPTLIYDINNDTWSRIICDGLGIDITKLPEVRHSDEIIGNLSKQAAEETGLSESVLVVTGGNDTACAALGMGVVEYGMAGDDSGTASVLFVDVPKPAKDVRIMTMAHVLPGHYLAVAPMSSVGSVLKWFRDEFCDNEQTQAKATCRNVFDLLCEQARASGPGGNGIVCLPYLAGERAPIWDPHAKGVFFGISLASRKRDFIRAILESGGYGMRWNISVIEEILGMKLSEIVCAGGQAASSFLVQLKADITGKTYYVSSKYREAATLGAAVLAGRGLGLNCKVNASEHRREFNPDKRNSKTYQTHYDLYKRLYFDLRKEFSHAR